MSLRRLMYCNCDCSNRPLPGTRGRGVSHSGVQFTSISAACVYAMSTIRTAGQETLERVMGTPWRKRVISLRLVRVYQKCMLNANQGLTSYNRSKKTENLIHSGSTVFPAMTIPSDIIPAYSHCIEKKFLAHFDFYLACSL